MLKFNYGNKDSRVMKEDDRFDDDSITSIELEISLSSSDNFNRNDSLSSHSHESFDTTGQNIRPNHTSNLQKTIPQFLNNHLPPKVLTRINGNLATSNDTNSNQKAFDQNAKHNDYENIPNVEDPNSKLNCLKRFKATHFHFNDCYLPQIIQTTKNYSSLIDEFSSEVSGYQDRIAFLSQRILNLSDKADGLDVSFQLCIPDLEQLKAELADLAPVPDEMFSNLFLPSSRNQQTNEKYTKASIDVEVEEAKLARLKQEIAHGQFENPYELLRLSSRNKEGIIQNSDVVPDYEAVKFSDKAFADPIKAKCIRLLDRTLTFRKSKPTSADLLREKYINAAIDSPFVKPKSAKHRYRIGFSRSKSHIEGEGLSTPTSDLSESSRLRTVSRSSPIVSVPIDISGNSFDSYSVASSRSNRSSVAITSSQQSVAGAAMRRVKRSCSTQGSLEHNGGHGPPKPSITNSRRSRQEMRMSADDLDPAYDRLSDVAVDQTASVTRRPPVSKEQRLERCSSVPPKNNLRTRAKAFFTRRRSFSSSDNDHKVQGAANVFIDPESVKTYARRHHSDNGLLDDEAAQEPQFVACSPNLQRKEAGGTLRKLSRSLNFFSSKRISRSRDKTMSIASQESLASKDSIDRLAGRFNNRSRSTSPEGSRQPDTASPASHNSNFPFNFDSVPVKKQVALASQATETVPSERDILLQNLENLDALVRQRKQQRALAAECVSNLPAIPLERVKVWLKSGSNKKRRHSSDSGSFNSITPTGSLQRRMSKQVSVPEGVRQRGLGVSMPLSRSTAEQLNLLSRQFSQAVTLRRSYQSREKLHTPVKHKEAPQRISSGNWSGSSASSGRTQDSRVYSKQDSRTSKDSDSALGLRFEDDLEGTSFGGRQSGIITGSKMSKMSASATSEELFSDDDTMTHKKAARNDRDHRPPPPPKRSTSLRASPVAAHCEEPIYAQVHKLKQIDEEGAGGPPPVPRLDPRILNRQRFKELTERCKSRGVPQSNSSPNISAMRALSPPPESAYELWQSCLPYKNGHHVVKPFCRKSGDVNQEVLKRRSAGETPCPFTPSQNGDTSPANRPGTPKQEGSPAKKVGESPAIYQKLYSLTPPCGLADEEDFDTEDAPSPVQTRRASVERALVSRGSVLQEESVNSVLEDIRAACQIPA